MMEIFMLVLAHTLYVVDMYFSQMFVSRLRERARYILILMHQCWGSSCTSWLFHRFHNFNSNLAQHTNNPLPVIAVTRKESTATGTHTPLSPPTQTGPGRPRLSPSPQNHTTTGTQPSYKSLFSPRPDASLSLLQEVLLYSAYLYYFSTSLITCHCNLFISCKSLKKISLCICLVAYGSMVVCIFNIITLMPMKITIISDYLYLYPMRIYIEIFSFPTRMPTSHSIACLIN